MVGRVLKKELIEASKKMPVISLTGPRQSGKTTLARGTFPHYKYINLEAPDRRMLALKDPRGFLEEAGYEGVIIDEAQHAPELFSYIQEIVDEKKAAKYLLTGSQNFLLAKGITQSLAGRVRILNLLPLSIAELMASKNCYEDHISYLFKGGYPALYRIDISPQKWLSSYVQSYLERDVRDSVNIRNLSLFQRFLQLCAARIGCLFNHTEVANTLGVSVFTIKQWLSVLEASYVVYMLPPYYNNFGQRIIKSPKLYFYDTGLACYLLGLEKERVLSYYRYGSLFENFILNEIVKSITNSGKPPSLYFWRESNGKEIDLMVPKGGKVIPIEIKASQTLRYHFYKNIEIIRKRETGGPYLSKGYVIYAGDESHRHFISWKDLGEKVFPLV